MMGNRKNRGFIGTTLMTIFVLTLCLISCLPILLIISVSLSSGGELYAGNILPKEITAGNYQTLLFETDFLLWVKNSIFVAGTTAILAVLITSLTAYTLSRYAFKGRDMMTSTLLVIQLFPGVMSLVAIYKILQFLGLLDSHTALILVYLGGAVPFTTWMIKGFFDTIPTSIEEAAAMDGAGPLSIYLFIILPMSAPILMVAFAFNFIAAYSDFLLSAVVLTDSRLYTLALGLRAFLEGDFSTNWPVFGAASLLGSLPIVIMFIAILGPGLRRTGDFS